jgi:hypothetical protein
VSLLAVAWPTQQQSAAIAEVRTEDIHKPCSPSVEVAQPNKHWAMILGKVTRLRVWTAFRMELCENTVISEIGSMSFHGRTYEGPL